MKIKYMVDHDLIISSVPMDHEAGSEVVYFIKLENAESYVMHILGIYPDVSEED